MFSKKTRNLTVAVLALVMALTLSFGLFGFTAVVNAAGADEVTVTTSTDNLTKTWDFTGVTGEVNPIEDGTIEDFLGDGTGNVKIKFNKDKKMGYLQLSGSKTGVFYLVVPAGSAGSINITCDGSNAQRYLLLNDVEEKKLAYAGSGKVASINFVAADITTYKENSVLKFVSYGGDYKARDIYITLTTGTFAKGYKVEFAMNGGEGTIDPMNYVIGGSALTLPTATRTGYTFNGWNDGTTTYAAGVEYTPTANVTLTAQWTANTYDVTLDGTTTVKATYGQPLPNVTAPTKEDGSVFTGYYDATGTQYYYDNGTSAVEAYTLTTGLALSSKWISPDMKFTATWKWNAEDATAELTLTGEDGKTVVTPDNAENKYTREVTLAPTCTTAGSQNVTVTHTYLGTEYKGTQTLEMAALGHTMTAIAAKAPACEVAGNNAYYQCSVCELYFKDEAGNTATTVEAEVIPALVHDYNVEPTWKVDGTTATATFACKNGCGKAETETAEATESVVDPTETALGYKTQTAKVTHNGNEYNYSAGVIEFVYHTTNEKMYAVQFVDVPALSDYTYPTGWELTQKSDTKGNDTCHYMGKDVKPLHLGNKTEPYGQITYTMPTAMNIEKIVVFAANLSDSKKTAMNVQIKDANGTSLYQTAKNVNINGSKEIAAYTVTPDAVANNAKQVLITNGTANAKLSVLEVVIYYAADYTVTVVDGETTTSVGVYGTEYTLPAQAGLDGYTNLGWTDGTNLYKAGDKVTLTADTTVTALYAKLAFVGGSIRIENTGVRYKFELEFYNVSDKAIMDYVGTTISGQYTLKVGDTKTVTADLVGYFVEGNKILMNAVIVNKVDCANAENANKEADIALCNTVIVASIKINVAGSEMGATGTGMSMATIAGDALGRKEIELALAQKYGYVAPTQA